MQKEKPPTRYGKMVDERHLLFRAQKHKLGVMRLGYVVLNSPPKK
jgi:hypothetical protein